MATPVVIDIITKVKDAALDKLMAKLAALDALAKGFREMGRDIERAFGQGNSLRPGKWLNTKSVNEMNKAYLKFFKSALSGFNSLTGAIFKFSAVQTGILSAGLAAVTLAFKVGSWAIKAWQASLAAAAGVAAGAMAVITGFLAAQREFQGAMAANNYVGGGPLGSRQNQSIGFLQQIQSDSDLAVAGLKGVQAAFQGVSKSTPMNGNLRVALKSMGDFAVASGDLEKGMATAGEFLGLLQKEGSLNAKVQQAGAGLGIEFQDAMKTALKQGKVSTADFLAALNAGELNSKVVGLLDGVNETLMGRIKGFGTEMVALFTDLGQAFIPEAKIGFEQIADILRGSTIRIAGAMQGFAAGPVLKTFVSATDKISNFIVNLFEKYLPKTEGMLGRIRDWFVKARGFFRNFVDAIRPLKEGGKVILDSLKPIFKGFFGGSVDSMRDLSQELLDNRDKFYEFGEAIGKLFRSVSKLFSKFRSVMIQALPVITNLIGRITDLVDAMASLFGKASGGKGNSKGGNPLGSYGLLALLAFAKFGGPSLMRSKGFTDAVLGKQTVGWNYATKRNPKTGMMETVARQESGRSGGFAATFGGRWLSPRTSYYDSNGQLQYGKMKQSTYGAAALGVGSMFASNSTTANILRGGAVATYLTPGQMSIGSATINPSMVVGGVTGLAAAGTSRSPLEGGAFGAMGGAMGGAALLSVTGPIGILIGAVLGGIFGAIMGAVNKAKEEKKRTEEVGKRMADGLRSQVIDGMMKNASPESMRRRVGELVDYSSELSNFYKDQLEFYNIQADVTTEYMQANTKNPDNFKTRKKGKYKGQIEIDGMVREERLREEKLNFLDSRNKLVDQGVQLGLLDEKSASFIRREIYNWIGKPDTEKAKAIDNKLKGVAERMERVIGIGEDVYNANLFDLTNATGMASDELTKLAAESGVSLYDETLNVVDAMKKMGIQIPQTIEQFRKVVTNNWIKSAQTAFDKVFGPINAQYAVDQAAEGFRGLTGPAPAQMIGDFMRTLAENAAILFPDDPQGMQDYFFKNIGPGGVQFSDPNSPLYGREADFNTGPGKAFRDQFSLTNQLNNAGTASTVLLDYVDTFTNGKSGVNMDQAKKFFAGKSIDEQEAIVQNLQNRKKMYDALYQKYSDAGIGKEQAQQMALAQMGGADVLGQAGLGGSGIETMDYQKAFFDSLSKDQQVMYQAISQSIKDANAEKPDWYQKGPEWWKNGFTVTAGDKNTVVVGGTPGSGSDSGGPGDTMTSRLALTMARHGQLNRMVSGKRTVTSSWRNTNLGSINSDHVTGNAYDLTGQNLGAYSRLVNGTGGFAEFHGHGGNRHLHVVPGPGLPMGDTGTPLVPTAMVTTPPGSSTFHITVNGAQASPEQIAMVVMQRIEQKQRSVRERS